MVLQSMLDGKDWIGLIWLWSEQDDPVRPISELRFECSSIDRHEEIDLSEFDCLIMIRLFPKYGYAALSL